ncbi:MAG TPA: isoprenylcysteine carboxylmethyltransferase family protein [Rhizomicrobium sp.]|nr:isoprenylcysteine carboxylmethyltransferase family protein [Rhizomicrobium sp.]
MRPNEAIYIPWAVWAFTWMAAAVWADRTVKRPALGSQALYRSIEIAGFALLLVFRASDSEIRPPEFVPLWVLSDNAKWAMVWVAAFGFLFCWWARLHLGRLWSGSVTRKEGHHVVNTGPYAIVRHPIYTGIIIASLATMAIRGTGAAIAGVALIILGYWIKGRLEERFLRAELGAEPYDAYARKTAMLIPFVRL